MVGTPPNYECKKRNYVIDNGLAYSDSSKRVLVVDDLILQKYLFSLHYSQRTRVMVAGCNTSGTASSSQEYHPLL